MTLGLNKKCQERLIEKVTEHLPNMVVRYGNLLKATSMVGLFPCDEILPKSGTLREKLESFISDAPFFDFLSDTLVHEIYDVQSHDSESAEIRLAELDGYGDPYSTAKRLVDGFDSLPWGYSLTTQVDNDLGNVFCQEIKHFPISSNINIIMPDKDFINKFPLESRPVVEDNFPIGGLGLQKPDQWNQDKMLIQIRQEGFISKSGETATLIEGISLLKSFFGMAIALRLIKRVHTFGTWPSSVKMFIHKKVANAWKIERIHKLNSEISDALNNMIIDDGGGLVDTLEKKVLLIKWRFNTIKTVLSCSAKAERIMLAAQWLFDSFCGRNELLSFIQTTIALEILLGEKSISDRMGLGELLRNRCAYLIGKSREQREKILDDFNKAYTIRSKIVHRGKHTLNYEEKELFAQLQWICRRVIQEEIDLLVKDVKDVEK